MINLKLSKEEKKAMHKVHTMPDESKDNYPWGTKLEFDDKTSKKIPGLKGIKGGTMVKIKAIGKVVQVRTVDKGKDKTNERVEIQLQQIDISKANEAEESFNEE